LARTGLRDCLPSLLLLLLLLLLLRGVTEAKGEGRRAPRPNHGRRQRPPAAPSHPRHTTAPIAASEAVTVAAAVATSS